MKLAGFVRNDPDGAVYIEVEGEEESLGEFLAWCKDGPPMAKVSKVEIEEDSEEENEDEVILVPAVVEDAKK